MLRAGVQRRKGRASGARGRSAPGAGQTTMYVSFTLKTPVCPRFARPICRFALMATSARRAKLLCSPLCPDHAALRATPRRHPTGPRAPQPAGPRASAAVRPVQLNSMYARGQPSGGCDGLVLVTLCMPKRCLRSRPCANCLQRCSPDSSATETAKARKPAVYSKRSQNIVCDHPRHADVQTPDV